MQRYSVCPDYTTAKLLVMYCDEDSGDQNKTMQVVYFGESILNKWIGDGGEPTPELFLGAPAVSVLTISDKKVVQLVH